MNYQQCLRYLEEIQNLGIKFGLENVRTLLDAIGNPESKYPTILVAGTNGKGSVCAFLTRILTLHGFKTGLFTSPHLIRVEERFRIGNELISRESFTQLLSLLRQKIEELINRKKLLAPITYFEILTCLAFLFFYRQNVRIAVLEVGMGGRFDATNVVKPILSVITTISAEHQKFLGESLSQIAFEKAGIIKTGVPVICGVRHKEAYEAIKKRADELKALFIGVFDEKGCFKKKKKEEFNYTFLYKFKSESHIYTPSILGEHQGRNAAVAIAASQVISQRWNQLKKETIIQGIESTRWEGRMEILSKNPLFIVDGAHNEEGAQALRNYIEEFISTPIVLIFACMRDKKIESIADIIFPLAKKIICTRFSYFRAASPEDILNRAQKFSSRIILAPDVTNAIELAFKNAPSNEVVISAGSLYLVGEIKKYFRPQALIPSSYHGKKDP